MRRLGVDEKSAGRGQNYVTVVARLEAGTGGHSGVRGGRAHARGHRASVLAALADLRAGAEAVVMDLWPPYLRSTLTHVPEAEGSPELQGAPGQHPYLLRAPAQQRRVVGAQ